MSVQDEAAGWFAKLHRGVLTLEEHGAYARWIAVRANRAALTQMEQLWGELEHARPRGQHLGRKLARAALAASLVRALLSFTGNSAFWTSLDWANR